MSRRFAGRSGPIVLGLLSLALAPFVGLVRAVAAVGRDPQTRGLLAGAGMLLGLLDAIAGQRIGVVQRRRARVRSSHTVEDTGSRDYVGPSAE